MDTDLLVEQKDDGRRLIEQLVRDKFEVALAFWVKTSDDGLWQLIIASPLVDEERSLQGYRKLYASMDKSPSSWVTPADIKLLNDQNAIARAAIKVRDSYPGKTATEYQGKRLGDLAIRAAYIYPDISPRLSFTVRYVRSENTNTWTVKVKRGRLYRDVNVKGAVSYSTAQRPGETEADQRFVIVGVLVAFDPKFDHPEILDDPDMRKMMEEQAEMMADEMFRTYHPDAVIKHDEDEEELFVSKPSPPRSLRETIIEHVENVEEPVMTEKGPGPEK